MRKSKKASKPSLLTVAEAGEIGTRKVRIEFTLNELIQVREAIRLEVMRRSEEGPHIRKFYRPILERIDKAGPALLKRLGLVEKVDVKVSNRYERIAK